MLLAVSIITSEIAEIRRPRLSVVAGFQPRDINFQTLSDTFYDEHMGFSRAESERVFRELRFPARLLFHANTSHQFSVSGEHCFLYFLYELRTPSQRQSRNEINWGYDYSTLSKIKNGAFDWIDATHRHRLNQLPEVANKFGWFSQKIKDKIRYPNGYIPPEGMQTAIFIDGCRIQTCKPGVRVLVLCTHTHKHVKLSYLYHIHVISIIYYQGSWFIQHLAFSGDKWYHNHGIQAGYGPDGMFYHWYDGVTGCNPDVTFLRQSRLNFQMAVRIAFFLSQHICLLFTLLFYADQTIQLNDPVQYWVYGDKGYTNLSHVRCAHHGPAYVSPQQISDNIQMSSGRVGIEWGFGKIKQRCPYCTHKNLLKLRSGKVARIIRVCALMTNIHTSLNQSQSSGYFDCRAPTLEEYLN